MGILKQTEKLCSLAVAALCSRKRKFQAEPVFIKEFDSEGTVHLTRVLLTEIYTNGQCVVTYPYDNEEQRSLADLCLGFRRGDGTEKDQSAYKKQYDGRQDDAGHGGKSEFKEIFHIGCSV